MNQFTETTTEKVEKQQTLSEIASQIEQVVKKKKIEVLNQLSVPEVMQGLRKPFSPTTISTHKIFGGNQIEGEYREGVEYDVDEGKWVVCVKFDGEIIEGADFETFEYLANGYAKDKNNVYHNGFQVKGTDTETFGIVKKNFAKDKDNLYFYGQKIDGASTENFEILDEFYLESEGVIYYQGEATEIDKDDFKNLLETNDGYLIGDNFVYYKGKKTELNPKTIEFVPFGKSIEDWVRDDKIVYVRGELVKGANPETFENIDDGYLRYFRDDKTIFYKNILNTIKATKANRETFELIKTKQQVDLAKDKDNIYLNGKKEDIKPENVEILGYCYLSIGNKIYHLDSESITDFGADASSFEVLTDNMGKDKNSYYYFDEKIEGFTPKSSRFINAKKEGFEIIEKVMSFLRETRKIDYVILDDEKACLIGEDGEKVVKHNLFEEIENVSVQPEEIKEEKKGFVSRVLKLLGK